MNLRWQIAQFFELKWWQLYLKRREQKAYLDWKKAYWRRFLQEAGLHLPDGYKVLDAGCGPAGIFILLDNQNVTAIDPLLNTYEAALPHFKKSQYPNVQFECTALEAFTAPAPFDAVFCLNAINHVADIHKCFRQLASLTKNGGTAAISIDAHKYQAIKKLFRAFPGDILHPHQYDQSEYIQMADAAGFAVDRMVLLEKGRIFDYVLLVAQKRIP